ncbi:MAG: polysaccharide lyase family 7 protein [Colwellia sp.]
MNYNKGSITNLLGLVMMIMLCLSTASFAVTIENAGFESGWSDWDDEDPSAISGIEYTGVRSAKITGSGGRFSQTVTVTENTDYILSAWLLGSGTIGEEMTEVSLSNDFSEWTKVNINVNSGNETSLVIYGSYYDGEGRFDDFSLTQVGEIIDPPTETGELEISTVSASSDDGNMAENTLDGDLSSRWSANGDGEYITYDLGAISMVYSVDIAFYKGSSRSATFDVLLGNTEEQLELVASFDSSGNTVELESFDFVATPAQLVRIVGYGNSSNSWNSLTDVNIFGDVDITDVAPIAVITAPDSGVLDAVITVDASGSYDPDGGSITSYQWNFGDGDSATGVLAEHTYAAADNFIITLTVTDDEGKSSTSSHNIAISDWQQAPVAIINMVSSATPQSLIQFTGSNSYDPDGGEISGYAWGFGDGDSSVLMNPEKSYSAEGTFTVSLTVTDDEGQLDTSSREIRIAIAPVEDLWPFINASFEESSSEGGWVEDDPSNVVSTNGTSDPQPPEGDRLLVIKGDGGLMKQALYKPIAGHVYEVTAYVYGHGTIGIDDLGSDTIFETTTAHGEAWQQISVSYVSTGSPALLYAKYGNGEDNAYFDMFEAHDISTQEDLDKTPPTKIMRYPSQVIDLSWWKLTLPIDVDEVYTPELYSFTSDEWFKLVEDEDGYAIQFRANHGGSTTSGSSNPRSEFRELTQNYHYQNSKSAASWDNSVGRHEMWIKQKVTHLTSVKPHVVVGQIHDSGDDVVVFRLEGHQGDNDDWNNGGTPGVLDTHGKLWLTDGNTTHGYLVDDNYELGTVFEVKFIAENGKVSFEYNGELLPYTHDESFSGAYFKMGNYTQSHSGTAENETDDAYAETYIYDYYIIHEE